MTRYLLIASLVLIAGCATAKDVQVRYAMEFQQLNPPPPAIEVYVIGADDSNIQKFRDMSIDRFFAPGKTEPLRQYVDNNKIGRRLAFNVDDPRAKIIAKNDPIRAQWKAKGATYLIIIQDYPHTIKDNPPAGRDSRYLEMSMDDSHWTGEELIISLGSSGPSCESAAQ